MLVSISVCLLIVLMDGYCEEILDYLLEVRYRVVKLLCIDTYVLMIILIISFRPGE